MAGVGTATGLITLLFVLVAAGAAEHSPARANVSRAVSAPFSPRPAVRGLAAQRVKSKGLPRLWGVQVTPGRRGWFDKALLKRVRRDGINALILRVSTLRRKGGTRVFNAVRRFAAAKKLYLIAVLPAGKPRTSAARHAAAACSSRRFSRLRCAVQAPSAAAAKRSACNRTDDSFSQLVAVNVSGPRSLSGFAGLPRLLPRRVLVIAPLRRSFNASDWTAAILQTAASPALNMGVAPRRKASPAVRKFAALLARVSGSAAGAPTDGHSTLRSVPTNLARGIGQTSAARSWTASTGVGVKRDRMYSNSSQAATSAPATAHLFMATTGSASCTRNASAVTYTQAVSQGNVCAGFNKAYAIAADGDRIPVVAGEYPAQGHYFDSATVHATPVTFTCGQGAGEASVTFDTARFIIYRANGLAISGRCFRFQLIDFGESQSNASNITVDAVHMESFDIAGAKNITIANSQIGPSVACTHGTGTSSDCGQPGAVWPETWYASKGLAADNEGNGQAQIRNGGGPYLPTGITLLNNYIHDFHTRGGGMHGGCFQSQVGGTLNWTIIGNAFERCTSQGLLFDANVGNLTYSGLTIVNNFFGYTTGMNADSSLYETSGRDLKFKTSSGSPTQSDVTIAYNSFTHGFDPNSEGNSSLRYSNVKIIGNVVGKSTLCRTASGITWDYNVYPTGSTCGDAHAATSQAYDSTNPYAVWDEGCVQVQSWTPVAGPMPGVRRYPWKSWVPASAVSVATDYNGHPRTYPTNAGAVGP